MESIEYKKMYLQEDLHWWFVSKRLFINNILNNKKFSKILDIGCGTGKNLELLSKYGIVWGIDASDLAVDFCRKRHLKRVKKAYAQKLPFNNESFDLVTVFDVLYHQAIKSDMDVLREIYRVLKPGGHLLVTDCAHQWLYGPHDQAMQARLRYSKKDLINKITGSGFTVKRSSYLYMITFPAFVLNRLLKKYFGFHPGSDVNTLPIWLNKLLTHIQILENCIFKFINLPCGSSIIVFAQK